MKNINFYLFVTVLLLISKSLTCQISILPIDSATGQVSYIGVVNVDSANAKDLLNRSKNWFVHTFVSSKQVIQNIDIDNNIITGKALMPAHAKYMVDRTWGKVNFTISIFCKDNRYKYIISDFIHEGDSYATSAGYVGSVGLLSNKTKESDSSMANYYREKDLDRLCVELNEHMNELINSLKIEMNKKLETQLNDW